MKLNRSMIKENFYNWIRREPVRYLNEPFYERELENINAIINDLCNLSMEIMPILTAQETFVLRKRLGVYDNGVFQNFETIAKETGKTSSEIREISLDMCSELTDAIFRGYYISRDKKTKLSSLMNLEEYANFPFSKLGFDKAVNQRFHGTLYDFLSYSRTDLSKMGFGDTMYEIYFKIRSMGLKFIEDLTVEEKKAIIATSSEKMIDNSSVAWVTDIGVPSSYSESSRIYDFCYNSFETIGDLKHFIANDDEAYHKITEEMIYYASSVGIFLVDNFQTLENHCLTSKVKKLTDKYEELINEYEALTEEYEDLISVGYYSSQELDSKIIHAESELVTSKKIRGKHIFSWFPDSDYERLLEFERDKLIYEKERLRARMQKANNRLTVIIPRLNSLRRQLEIVEQQLNSTKKEMELSRTRKS